MIYKGFDRQLVFFTHVRQANSQIEMYKPLCKNNSETIRLIYINQNKWNYHVHRNIFMCLIFLDNFFKREIPPSRTFTVHLNVWHKAEDSEYLTVPS